MTTAFQSDAFQNDAFQIDAAVVVAGEGRGNWKLKKKSKSRVFKFSDLEGREEYAQAIAVAAIPIIQPRHDVPAPIDDEEEDAPIALMSLLH